MPSAGTDVIVTIRTAEEAVAVAREYAESIADGTIERDRSGAVPARELFVDMLAVLGTPSQRCPLSCVLPPNHGQI